MQDYLQTLSDEELVALAQANDKLALEVLLTRYRKMVNSFARNFYLSDGDTEDLAQAGLMAVFKAVLSYNGAKSLKVYAKVCVKNEIVSTIRKSKRDKNKPLDNFISLSGDENFEIDKSEIASTTDFDPEAEYINEESKIELDNKIKQSLSKLEYEIFTYYLSGYSYLEIANKIGKEVKAVDNAVQRIKKKIEKILK